MSAKRDREFQLAVLKFQMKLQALWSSVTLLVATEFAIFSSIAATFLSFGLISGNIFSIILSALSVVCLYVVARLTIRYFQKTGVQREFDENLEKEIQSIRQEFITKSVGQNEKEGMTVVDENKALERPVRRAKETQTNEKTEKARKMSIYEKSVVVIAAISLVSNVVLIGFNLYLVAETNRMHRENLEFQSMMYNFTSVITADADYAFLGEPSSYSGSDGVLVQTTHYGYADVDVTVITPHYGTVCIGIAKFNVGESSVLDSEKRNQTKVSFASSEDKYEYTVAPGSNRIDASIFLKATVYPDSQNLPPQGESVQFILGRLFLEADLFDMQTETTATKDFSTVIVVIMEAPP